MNTPVRTTIYLRPEIRKALKLYAAETDKSLSDAVNDIMSAEFLEDLEDITAIRQRQGGDVETYESFLAELKAKKLV